MPTLLLRQLLPSLHGHRPPVVRAGFRECEHFVVATPLRQPRHRVKLVHAQRFLERRQQVRPHDLGIRTRVVQLLYSGQKLVFLHLLGVVRIQHPPRRERVGRLLGDVFVEGFQCFRCVRVHLFQVYDPLLLHVQLGPDGLDVTPNPMLSARVAKLGKVQSARVAKTKPPASAHRPELPAEERAKLSLILGADGLGGLGR
mmetsp:Transcript_20369/g.51451  ORF Transcript_20369/g.51451 Transcript_20369/m.51451 type:complete len:200 (+) Transcript_20369:3763-4362(+)